LPKLKMPAILNQNHFRCFNVAKYGYHKNDEVKGGYTNGSQ